MTYALFTSKSKVEGDNRIYEDCLLFKSGNYPDKKFSADSTDLATMVKGTKLPLCFNLEHDDYTEGARQILACKMGKITDMWIDPDDADTVRGRAEIPLDVDQQLENKGVSMEPYIDKTAFAGCALTYTPRVKGAALMSESLPELVMALFANMDHKTPHGQRAMQEMHDLTARHGAVCKMAKTKMTAKHEMTAFQAIHDMTSEHGSKCYDGSTGGPIGDPMYGYYNSSPPNKESPKRMKFTDVIKSWIGLGSPDEIDPAQFVDGAIAPKPLEGFSAAVLKAPDVKETAEFKALQAEAEAAKAEVAKMAEDRAIAFKSECETAVKKLVAEFKITPAEVEKFTALRAKDAESFDALAANFAVRAELNGGINPQAVNLLSAEELLKQANADPKTIEDAAKFKATIAGLQKSGYASF